MNRIQIMTDAASDISQEDEKKYSISIIPFPVTIGGKTYLKRAETTGERFYALMAKYDEIPLTSQINPYQFEEIYFKQANEGVSDLILVLINSLGSATFDNARAAEETFYRDHPEYKESFRIHCFDGLGYDAMYGAVVVQAAKMNADGASLREILDYIGGILPRRRIYFGLFELKYASKSGRIPPVAAFLGQTLNLKPILKIGNGKMKTVAKCLGAKSLLNRLVSLTAADIEPGSPYELLYGNNPERLDELSRYAVALLGYEPDAVYRVGAAIAANSGPNAIGIAFTEKHT